MPSAPSPCCPSSSSLEGYLGNSHQRGQELQPLLPVDMLSQPLPLPPYQGTRVPPHPERQVACRRTVQVALHSRTTTEKGEDHVFGPLMPTATGHYGVDHHMVC